MLIFVAFLFALIGAIVLLTSRRTAVAVSTGGDHDLVAAGRGPDIEAVRRMAQVVVEQRQRFQDGG